MRRRPGKTVEACLLREQPRRVHEPAPRRAGECAADADSPHTQVGECSKAEARGRTHQHVNGFGCNGGDHRANLCGTGETRRIETIRAGLGIGLQAGEGFAQIGTSHEKAFGTRHQERIAAGSVDGATRSGQALDCGVDLEKRRSLEAGGILDGQSGDARGHRLRDTVGHLVRRRAETAFEVGIDRHVGGGHQFAQRPQHLVRDSALSGRPSDQANPELVLARALKPRLCKYTALPTSQGLGMRKHPDSCSCLNARRLSAMLGRLKCDEFMAAF